MVVMTLDTVHASYAGCGGSVHDKLLEDKSSYKVESGRISLGTRELSINVRICFTFLSFANQCVLYGVLAE